MKFQTPLAVTAVVFGFFTIGLSIHGFDEPSQALADKKPSEKKPPANGVIPLNVKKTVLLDTKGKRLLLKTTVVLREGPLEMLCCRAGTKEHESILSVDAKAVVIHAGLIALGAEAGAPVKYSPKYEPAHGQRIDVFLQWKDKKGKPHRVPAQRWVRHSLYRFYAEPLEKLPAGLEIPEKSELRYDAKHRELSWYGPMTVNQRERLLKLTKDEKFRNAIGSFFKKSQPRPMKTHWIFAGSGFYGDPRTGQRGSYMAEGGDVICVANFPTAMIDVAVESSAVGEENLLFEADTEKIPPLETEVTMELIPEFKKKPLKK